MHRRANPAVFIVLLGSIVAGACSPPQAGPENQHVIASLRTALSAKNPEWLEQNVALIEKRYEQGKMSDEAYETFKAIVHKAQDGQWKEAERDVVALQKAQRPQRE